MGSTVHVPHRPLTFEVTFLVEPEDDGRYHAWAPLLKGLHAEGATVTEALQNARELAQLYLETLIEDGDPIPLGPGPSVAQREPIPHSATAHLAMVTVSA